MAHHTQPAVSTLAAIQAEAESGSLGSGIRGAENFSPCTLELNGTGSRDRSLRSLPDECKQQRRELLELLGEHRILVNA